MDNLRDYEFDWTSNPKELRQCYKSTQFDSLFHKLIAKQVIAVLSPQLVPEPHNLIYDDELVYKKLIGPLERFICNISDDSPQEEVDRQLDHLRTLKQPTKMCHKVLKTGDVLFSCNDCSLDATCVVCIDCFHKSAHKDHNYRMSNTDGGGCCDCGDIEAWKQYPACSDHEAPDQPNLKLSDYEDRDKRSRQLESDKLGILEKISLLPKGFASRYFLICQACLHYARNMLTWNDYHLPPQCLDITNELDENDENDQKLKSLLSKNNSKNYFTVLFNDEIHTYDHVINTLVKIIKCSKMTASIMASSVSREGRSLILQDQFKPCKQIRDAISCVRDSGQGPLTIEVIHGTILAHQAYALKLIEWIQRMSLLCDAFRVLTAFTLLGTHDPIPDREEPTGDMTLLEKIMRSNTSYWKMARIDWNDLFVTTLLTEYSIKDRFSRLLTRIYPDLVKDFVEDDHDHSVSVLTMTTQLYTVPSLVCMLIEEEDALSIIAQTLNDVCLSKKRETPAIDFENRNTWDMQGLKRGFYIIADLRHLINVEPTKWTEELRVNVIRSVKIFLNLLNTMQGMDSVRRQVGQHIEYEPEWETGMTLQSRLVGLITRLVKYCSHDEVVLTETIRETQLRLLEDGGFKFVTKELFHHTANCIQYDVSTLPVTVHLPLTRFAGALMLELMQRRPCKSIPYDESLVILSSKSNETKEDSTTHDQSKAAYSMIDIMEPSLRTEVMIAQFRTGMWRRNGYSLVNQIIYFSGASMRREMYDRDILILQESAAMCDANKFMIHILNKFNLINWVKSETTREALVGSKAVSFHNDEDIMTQTMSLGEEFLQILLTIVGERYRVGVGKIEEDDVIKHEIIQLLCIGPYTRSEIAQKLYVNDSEIDCVKHVANLKRSSESSTGKYELKPNLYDRFNPFFYHYSRRHQSHALDAQLKRKRNAKESLICCPPPVPVELTDQFANLNELLICDVTLMIVQKILRRALGPPADAVECSTRAPIRFLASDLQLDQCLHLIGLGLHEQARRPNEYNYIKAAYEKEIIYLLRDCHQVAKRSKDLVFWLVKKMNDIIDVLEQQDSYSMDDQSGQIHSNIRECLRPILSACDSVRQESLKKNSELAAQRRERIMALMKAKQASFLSNPATKQLAAETARHEAPSAHDQRSRQTTRSSSSFVALREIAAGTSGTSVSTVLTSTPTAMDFELTPVMPLATDAGTQSAASNDPLDDRMDSQSITTVEDDQSSGTKTTAGSLQHDTYECPSHLCILCRDEQVIGFDRPTMVLLAYIQRSAVLSKNRSERHIPNYSLTPTNQIKHLSLSMPLGERIGTSPKKYSFTSDNSWSFDATFMPSDLFFGPYISTCGHVMHYDCWKSFYDTITKRETSRPNRGARHVSFELEKNEILCPLCECISNATIPLIADYTNFAHRQHLVATSANVDLDRALTTTIFGISREAIDKSSESLTAFLCALRGTVTSFEHVRHLNKVADIMKSYRDIKYMRLLQPTPINDVLKDLNERDALVLRDFIANIRNDRVSASVCTSALLGAIQTLTDRIHSVGLDLDKSIADVHDARIFMMTSWTISYTIQAQERSARFRGAPIFEDMESSKNLCLSSLVRFANSSMLIYQSDMIQSLLVQKLRYLLISEEHLMSSPCCLDIDAFELFVSVFIMLQKLYSHIRDDTSQASKSPGKNHQHGESLDRDIGLTDSGTALDMSMSGGRNPAAATSAPEENSSQHTDSYAWTTRAYDHEYFRNLLHLTLILNLLQVSISILNDISTAKRRAASSSTVVEEPASGSSKLVDDQQTDNQSEGSCPKPGISGNVKKEYTALQNFLQDIVLASGHPCGKISGVDEQFVARIKRALLPFLRSCAIFFYQLSHITPDETLVKLSAFNEGKNFAHSDHLQTNAGQSTATANASTAFSGPSTNHPTSDIDYQSSILEFNAICRYLNLPNDLSILLRSKEARDLALTWLRHSRVLVLIKDATETAPTEVSRTDRPHEQLEASINHGSKKMNSSPGQLTRASSSSSSLSAGGQQQRQHAQPEVGHSELMPVKFIRQPHSVNQLIDLPYDYSELVDKVSNFTCPSIKNEDSRTPTMCLVCGVMLCSQSYCCQRDLNDLASNYKQVVRRQEENRHQWLAAAAAASSSATSSSGAANAAMMVGRSDAEVASGHQSVVAGTQAQASTMAAFSALFSNIGANPLAGVGGASNSGPGAHQTSAALRSTFTNMLSNSHINQQLVGSCTFHAHECSGGVGVFLRIRNCQILLLSGRSKGCYMPAPYIDDHGETDFGLVRGNPLHLNRQLYERLQNTWMNHTIPEQISRTLEYSPYASNINWHLH